MTWVGTGVQEGEGGFVYGLAHVSKRGGGEVFVHGLAQVYKRGGGGCTWAGTGVQGSQQGAFSFPTAAF